MLLIDANAILRYMLCDNVNMAEQVEELLKREVVTVKNEVLAEVVYVLIKVYKLPKTEVYSSILQFLDLENVYIENKSLIVFAMKSFSQTNLDFVDTLLHAYSVLEGARVFTFDKKLLSKIERVTNEQLD